MALAAWKRIEKSPGYQRAKIQLKRLVGKELSLRDAGYKIIAVSETGREVSFLLADGVRER